MVMSDKAVATPLPPDVLTALGGPAVVARHCGVSAQAVCNWRRLGVPPARHAKLFELAQAAGIDWRPRGFERLALTPAAPPRAEAA